MRRRRERPRNPDRLDDPTLRQAIRNLGCVLAGADECKGMVVVHHERHHTGMGQKAGDNRAFGVCVRHHTTGKIGVAIHANIKAWEARWGLQDYWVSVVHEQLRRSAYVATVVLEDGSSSAA